MVNLKIVYLWKYHKYYKHQYLIVKNIGMLGNYCDPISQNVIFENNKISDIKQLFPIFRGNKMYIYELKSLKDIIDNNSNKEIFSNTELTNYEINNIKFLTSKIKNEEIKLSKEQELYFRKSHIFTIFHELDTYFSITMYNRIDRDKFKNILSELKMMWDAFKTDNNLSEIELFGCILKWNSKNYEDQLLTNIKIIIDNKLDKSFKKALSYVIIGAFAYVDKDIKKMYNDIDFI